ncbi:hypothetical protein ACEPAF_5573 [Sanghuangporus sanghuang]
MGLSLWVYSFFAFAFCATVYFRQETRKLPPGPSGLPFLGHAMKIPRTLAWRKFAEWSKPYGPVIFLEVLEGPVIIVNFVDAAFDLMKKKGATFSDRPRAPVAAMIGWGFRVSTSPYGQPQFHNHRQLMQEHLVLYVPAWVPGMGLKGKVLEARDAAGAAFTLPFEEAKSKKASGIVVPGIIHRLLGEYDDLREMSSEDGRGRSDFSCVWFWKEVNSLLVCDIAFNIPPCRDPVTGEDVYPVPEFESGLI